MKREVTIKPYRTSNGTIDFRMYDGSSKVATDTLSFDKNKNKMPKSESYMIHFALENAPDTNLVFLQDSKNKQECMWVAEGSKLQAPHCPKGSASHPEIQVDSVADLELVVENRDLTECKYKFVLNFQDLDNNRKVVRYDPIYENKNGGVPSSSMGLSTGPAAIVVGAIAVVGLCFLILR